MCNHSRTKSKESSTTFYIVPVISAMFHLLPLRIPSNPSKIVCLRVRYDSTWRLSASSGSSRCCDISLKRFCCCDIFWSSKVNLWISSCQALTADEEQVQEWERERMRESNEGKGRHRIFRYTPNSSNTHSSFIGVHLYRTTSQTSAFKKHRDFTHIIHSKVRRLLRVCAIIQVIKQTGSAEKVPSLQHYSPKRKQQLSNTWEWHLILGGKEPTQQI